MRQRETGVSRGTRQELRSAKSFVWDALKESSIERIYIAANENTEFWKQAVAQDSRVN